MSRVTLEASGTQPTLSIHYRDSGDPGADRTLVFVHELGGTLESYDALRERLPSSWRVIAFDQRGAGRSEHPTRPFTIDDLAEDIRRLVDALRLRGRLSLFGMAMGAVTALAYAIRYGDTLTSLMLCDGTDRMEPEAVRYVVDRAQTVRSAGMRAVADASFSNAFGGLADPLANPDWAEYRLRFVLNAPHSYAMHSEALSRLRFDDPAFEAVSCPALVLTGRYDFIWPPDTGRRLAGRLPRSEFHVIEAGAHFPAVQAPDEVARRVLDFVERLG